MGDFAPFTSPLMKALQIKQMTEDIAYRREARAREQQAFQMHIEDRQHQQAANDFHTAMLLNSAGAVQATPQIQGLEAGLDQAVGPVTPESKKPLMNTPVGSYYVPTQEQQQDRADTRAVERAGKLKDATDPWTTIDVRGKSIRVRESQAPNLLIRMNPQMKPPERLGPNDNGDYTLIYRDPTTQQELYRTTEKGTGRSKATGASKEALPDRTAIEKYMNDWRGTIYSRLGITDQDQAIAKGTYQWPEGTLQSEITGAQKLASDKISHAETELEKKADAQAKSDIRARGASGQQSAPASPSAQPYAGKIVTQANAATIAKSKGIPLAQWIQQFQAGGGRVQ